MEYITPCFMFNSTAVPPELSKRARVHFPNGVEYTEYIPVIDVKNSRIEIFNSNVYMAADQCVVHHAVCAAHDAMLAGSGLGAGAR